MGQVKKATCSDPHIRGKFGSGFVESRRGLSSKDYIFVMHEGVLVFRCIDLPYLATFMTIEIIVNTNKTASLN